MADPKSDGRMIRKEISDSDKFAALTPEAAVLFSMMIPHYNSHGKMNGGPGYIKEIVCPKIPYLTLVNIPELLAEISEKTNVKWFKYDKRFWIHSINFLSDHQKLDKKKSGRDSLPSYPELSPDLVQTESRLSPDKVHHEVEVEVEVKGEGKSGTSLSDLDEPQAAELDPLAQHSWNLLLSTVPMRNGKHHDLDACQEKYRRMRPKWKDLQDAAVNYRASVEVSDGIVMHLMSFLSGKYSNWLTPEQPSGTSPPKDLAWMKEHEEMSRDVERHRASGTRAEIIRPWPKTATV